MTIRVAAIGVSHWHALFDAAYLRHLMTMPDVDLVAVQDSDAGIVAKRAAEVGNPPTFTDYGKMLATSRPDFVIALGRHRQMAAIAHDLLDAGLPFLMEKPMGINAVEVDGVAAKAARLNAFVAVPLAQRYTPFARRARELLAAGRFGPLSHIYVRINRPGPARYPAWDCAWMLDPVVAGGGCLRNLGPHGFPRVGTDGEWKIAGRDAILTVKDNVMKLATAEGDEVTPGTEIEAPYYTTIRDALDCWQRGAPPPVGVADCARVARLIDQAYALATRAD